MNIFVAVDILGHFLGLLEVVVGVLDYCVMFLNNNKISGSENNPFSGVTVKAVKAELHVSFTSVFCLCWLSEHNLTFNTAKVLSHLDILV